MESDRFGIDCLREEYIPEAILHRDEALSRIMKVFSHFKEAGGVTESLLIFGVSGSGKTAILKKAIQGHQALYISGAGMKSSFQVFKEISGCKARDFPLLLKKAVEAFVSRPCVLILDEVNDIRNPDELFKDLETFRREARVPIIITTNRRNLCEEISADSKLYQRIILPAYNAFEIADILRSRMKIIYGEKATPIDEGFIQYVSALGAKEGSARISIRALREAIIDNNFTIERAERTNQDVTITDWKIFTEALSKGERQFLTLLAESCDSESWIAAPELFRDKMFEGVSPGRLSNLIDIFAMQHGLIDVETINRGRGGGRHRRVKLCSNQINHAVLEILQVKYEPQAKSINAQGSLLSYGS